MEQLEKGQEEVIVHEGMSYDAIIKLVNERGLDFDAVILEGPAGAQCRVSGAQVKKALGDLAQENVIYPPIKS